MTADKIEGWCELEEWFGYSPNFHDAEVVGVDLRREPEASIMRIHAWRTNNDLDASGSFRTDKHAIVSFEIDGICELQLDGWSRQNVLAGMCIDTAECGYVIHMSTSYGMEGRIKAKIIRVSVEPREA